MRLVRVCQASSGIDIKFIFTSTQTAFRIYVAPALVVEYVNPAPTVAYAAPVTTMTAPATVVTQLVATGPVASAAVLSTTYGALLTAYGAVLFRCVKT